ncbi:hypothetical protein BH09VER1_BH09VER1_26170 [soil metagenome]
MLDQHTFEVLENIAADLGRKLPELNKPADKATRIAIHEFFDVYEKKITDFYFKPIIDLPATCTPEDLRLSELNLKREGIRNLELNVFNHVNSFGFPG